MIDETNETQTFEYQQPVPTSEADIQVRQTEQSPTATPDAMQVAREHQAFEAYVKNQGLEIPSNFKDTSAWFNSLKNAQSEYTKARQEVAELKKTYGKVDGGANPTYVPEPTPEVVAITKVPEELRIPNAVPEVAKTNEPVNEPKFNDADWSKWSMEVAVSNDLSEETRAEIKTKTGFSDKMIGDYMEGQKARSREAFGKAADIVGSKDKLHQIFSWAAKTMTVQQQAEINATLASPSWEVALLGLATKYDRTSGATDKSKEMTTTKTQLAGSQTPQGTAGYKTKREFYADRGNPRYNSEPKFRLAVEQRMLQTDFNRLQN